MLSGVSIAAEFIMIIQGQGTSGKGLSLAFFLIIIGVPLTLITLNWTSNRRLPYSAFDKLLSQFFRQKKRPFKRKRYNHKQKRKRKKKW
jgi:hypothetical protein